MTDHGTSVRPGRLVSARAAEDAVGIAHGTVARLFDRGAIPAKVGGIRRRHLRVRVADVEAAVLSGKAD